MRINKQEMRPRRILSDVKVKRERYDWDSPLNKTVFAVGIVCLAGTIYSARNQLEEPSSQGVYKGYNVEAFYRYSIREAIISSPEDRGQRLIAMDLPGGQDFESIEFMFTPDNSPLRRLSREDIREAWHQAFKKSK